MRIGTLGADDQVVDAVAIEIAGAAEREAAVVGGCDAIQSKPVLTVQAAKSDGARERTSVTEDDIARA